MLEEVATYLMVAPLAASLILAGLAVFWYSGTRLAPNKVMARVLNRDSRRGER